MCKCVCPNCHQELADDETKWQGQNLLGKALNEVRAWLLEEDTKIGGD